MSDIVERYFATVTERLQKVADTQADAIRQAAEVCAAGQSGEKTRDNMMGF